MPRRLIGARVLATIMMPPASWCLSEVWHELQASVIHDVIKWKRVAGPLWGESTGHRCHSPNNGGFPSLRQVMPSFDVFLDLRLNKRLSEQSRRRWFEMPLRLSWRLYNAYTSWWWLQMPCRQIVVRPAATNMLTLQSPWGHINHKTMAELVSSVTVILFKPHYVKYEIGAWNIMGCWPSDRRNGIVERWADRRIKKRTSVAFRYDKPLQPRLAVG